MAETTTKEEEAAKRDESKITRLGSASIPKLIIEFAIPAIAGMMVNAAYNLIDALFLGQAVGEIGLAATQVAMPTMTVFLAIAMLIGSGGNALAALKLGEKKKDQAELVLGNTFLLGVIVWIIICICASIPAVFDFLLSISSATDEVRPGAEVFLRIISYGYILQVVGFGINNFIRTAGAPNRALLTMVVGAAACILFNYLFVIQLGWGIKGSALATVCGQACSFVSVLWYFVFTPSVPMKLRLSCLKIDWKLCGSILSLGISSFIMQIGGAVLTFATNFLLVKYGALHPIGAENALASIGLVMRITMLGFTPLMGLSVAVQPILGFNYGARNYRRVWKTLIEGIIAGIGLGAVMLILIIVFANSLVSMFGITDTTLVNFTVHALYIQVCMLPLVGFQVIGSNYFQATGQPLKSGILSLTRQILFLLPLLFIFPELLPYLFPGQITGLDAIIISIPVSDVLASAVTLVFDLIEYKHIKAKIVEHDELLQKPQKTVRSYKDGIEKAIRSDAKANADSKTHPAENDASSESEVTTLLNL